jgi:hypothetical protein
MTGAFADPATPVEDGLQQMGMPEHVELLPQQNLPVAAQKPQSESPCFNRKCRLVSTHK